MTFIFISSNAPFQNGTSFYNYLPLIDYLLSFTYSTYGYGNFSNISSFLLKYLHIPNIVVDIIVNLTESYNYNISIPLPYSSSLSSFYESGINPASISLLLIPFDLNIFNTFFFNLQKFLLIFGSYNLIYNNTEVETPLDIFPASVSIDYVVDVNFLVFSNIINKTYVTPIQPHKTHEDNTYLE